VICSFKATYFFGRKLGAAWHMRNRSLSCKRVPRDTSVRVLQQHEVAPRIAMG
jgi:hypothetical protein